MKKKNTKVQIRVSNLSTRGCMTVSKAGAFKESWLLCGPVMICFKVCLPVDHLGVLSRSWMGAQEEWRPSHARSLMVSYRWCERTTLWTSWAELPPSGSPPAVAYYPASGVAPPPATSPYPLSPEHRKTHMHTHTISSETWSKNKWAQKRLIKASAITRTSVFRQGCVNGRH